MEVRRGCRCRFRGLDFMSTQRASPDGEEED